MTYLGLAAGPVCASTFLPRFGWRSIFLVEVPAGIVCIMLALCALRPDLRTGRQQAPIPPLGTFLWIGCLRPFLLALGEGAHWRWRSVTVVSLFVTSAFVAPLFVVRESRCSNALIGMHLLRHIDQLRSIFSAALFYGGLYAVGFLIPILAMRQGQGRSVTELAGTMLLWQALTRMIATPLVGYLSDCFGSTRLIAAGCIVFGASALGLLVSWQRATPITLTVLIAFAGLGSSLFVPANSRRLFAVTPLGAHGTAARLQAIARNVGMLRGTAAAAAFNQTSLSLHRGDGQPVADGALSDVHHVAGRNGALLFIRMIGMLSCFRRLRSLPAHHRRHPLTAQLIREGR
jgi:MFS family permease